jgi:UDP-4-amino-4,6-dideoxy-N-acetyl-beta-L-altrosamine transaminase
MIPYGRQDISEDDIVSVIDVLRSDFLTQGPAVPSFEGAVAAYCGVSHALAVNSATSGLHIACLALGLGPGDWLWTSPVTFVASANCALYCGAQVDFVDIDPRTYNLSVERLEEMLIRAKREGRLPKVVVPVHLCGQSCDMASIGELGRKYGFRIVEDASHAIGGSYRDEPIGNCRHSDITVFSFHPVKIVTTGEGGMVLTKDPELSQKMALLRSHGITRDSHLMTHEPDGPWYYQQIALGFNYRMTDIQAALGTSQMARLPTFVARRQQLADRYNEGLSGLPLVTPWQHPDTRSARHLYVIRVGGDRGHGFHLSAFEALREAGIGVNLHYIPVYLHPHYRAMGFAPGLCPEAERYYAEAISLPLYSGLSDGLQDEVVMALRTVLAS